MNKVVNIKDFYKNGGKNMHNKNIIMHDKASVESLANDILESYDISKSPVDPVIIANKLGIKVYAIKFDTFDGDKVSGAITKDETGKIEILVNENDSEDRKRFTIAHELGHYFLHMKNTPKYERVDMHRSTACTTNVPQEIEANTFAAALLMDKDTIYKKFKSAREFGLSNMECVRYLSNLFKVSKSAMEYRLKNLGII